MDGPWDNSVWKGKKIGEITVPAGSIQEITKYTIDVSEVVDKLDKKHAIFLVAENNSKEKLCVLQGLGFSKKGKSLEHPTVPTVEIMVDGKKVDLPTTPVRSTNANGITGFNQYETTYTIPVNTENTPKVSATSNDPSVKIDVIQPTSGNKKAVVNFEYKGTVKTYTILLAE